MVAWTQQPSCQAYSAKGLPRGRGISGKAAGQLRWHGAISFMPPVRARLNCRAAEARAFSRGAGSRQPEEKGDTNTPPDRDHGRGQGSSLPQG